MSILIIVNSLTLQVLIESTQGGSRSAELICMTKL